MNASPSLVLALAVLCLVGAVAVAVVGGTWAQRAEDRERVRERLALGFPRVVPLPFAPPAATHDSEPTQPGAFCPVGAAAPKTVRPGSLSHRLEALRVPA